MIVMRTGYCIDLDINCPIGLKNTFYNENSSIQYANVCFFNSLIQVLISIPNYHHYILETSQAHNAVVMNLRDLFKETDNSNDCIDTFRWVPEIGIPDYVKNIQHDARECLSHILENSYPADELKDDSVFKIDCTVTLECECRRVYTRHEKHLFFKLDSENAENCGPVQLLLNRTLTINHYENKQHHCRGKLDDDPPDPSDPSCQRAGRCREYTVMSVPGDVLIIILQMCRHDEYYQPYKKILK